MIKKLMVGLVVCAALLTGCASVPMASAKMDTQAKTFTAKPDKANIYVYRHTSFGFAVKIDVALDGTPMGATKGHTYFVFEVDPGKHTLASKAENESVLEVVTEAGRKYSVMQAIYPGFWLARNEIILVDAESGESGVAECKLLEIQTAK